MRALLGHVARRRRACSSPGLATGALWTNVTEGTDLYDDVAYGLPALQDGRWWTFFTGMFFAPQLVLYVPILLLLVIVASVYERRVGHVRTIVVAIGGQFLAALLTRAVPVAVRRQQLDVGPPARHRSSTSASRPAGSRCWAR